MREKIDSIGKVLSTLFLVIISVSIYFVLISGDASAAHTFDTKATDGTGTFANSPNPRTLSYTAGSGTTVMVLNIYTSGSTARAGGAPTFNSRTFTQVGTRQYSGDEGAVEMWYLLLNPTDTGSAHNVSVPNTGSQYMRIHVSTYKSATGFSELEVYAQKSGTDSNPSQSLTTTVNGDVLIDAMFHGSGDVPSSNSNNLLYKHDGGSYTADAQYYLQSTAGSQSMSWTVSSNDWALITASFKEIIPYTVTGRVIYLANGTGVNGANITTNTSVSTTTNSTGYYSFTSSNKSIIITASKTGYSSPNTTITVSGANVTAPTLSLYNAISQNATATYRFLPSNGATVATGITTDYGSCGANPTSASITLLTTASTSGCTASSATGGTGVFIDLYSNASYSTDTIVTGQSYYGRINNGYDSSIDFTFNLIYAHPNGTVVILPGSGQKTISQKIDADYTISLAGITGTIPAGAKLGLRLSKSLQYTTRVFWFGDNGSTTGGPSGYFSVYENTSYPAPLNITSWSNNVTNNNSLSLSVNQGAVVSFNLTAEFAINSNTTTIPSGVTSLGNSSLGSNNFLANFSFPNYGTYYVMLNVSNTSTGSSGVNWTVMVNDITPPNNVTGVNNASAPSTYSVNLLWNEATDNDGGSGIKDYFIFLRNNSINWATKMRTEINASTVFETDPEDGKKNYSDAYRYNAKLAVPVSCQYTECHPGSTSSSTHYPYYMKYNESYLYIAAMVADNDSADFDDYLELVFDPNKDAASTPQSDDRYYEFWEDGKTKSIFKGNGSGWENYTSNAIWNVSRYITSDNSNITGNIFEVRIPLSEIGNLGNGSSIRMGIEVECTHGSAEPPWFSRGQYFPIGAEDDNPSTWNFEPVFRNNTVWDNIGTSTTNDFEATGLLPTFRYYFSVLARDNALNNGSMSSSKTITTSDQDGFNITGYVTGAGSPLIGAHISAGQYTVHSDSKGYYQLNDLINNTYSLEISAVQHTSNTTIVIINGSSISNLNITLEDIPSVTSNTNNAYRANNSILNLNATITDLGSGIKNATVNISSVNSTINEAILTNISGFWINNDAIADIGESYGFVNLTITAYDNAGIVNNSIYMTIWITPPELILTDTNISFSYTASDVEVGDVKENEIVTINATVFNVGNVDVNNIIVRFYDGSTDLNIIENVTIESLTAGERKNATINWSAIIGTHNISIKVDPDNAIPETNETNNNASRPIDVSAWQKYYGSLAGYLGLNDQEMNSFNNWSISGVDGNIFISSLTELNFSNLSALGRNKSGGLAQGNFSRADELLNMTKGSKNATGFSNNNITQIFSLDGTTPRNTTTFTVYGRNITNVPIVDSTYVLNLDSVETAAFITGILWDSSKDDGDGEFGDDGEDLVFIGKINLGKEGINDCLHDYEIAIPSTLGNGANVYFHVELINWN
ncbi:MAG: hypothetical protein OIN87_03860 [Candidatus Methanoperedens sp.]|nr:hypothetical protein [Candidatus Methanoperedens sp.]